MARATWLPDVLRAAGLTVREVDGWRTRGADTFDPYGLICHATAGRLDVATDIRVLLTGSNTAPPPISQLFLDRTGTWHIIASGRCNHALTGWAGPLKGYGNTRLIGIEAANDNRTEPWPPAQYESYARGVAAICKHLRWNTSRVAGHKEHQPAGYGHSSTKTDPTFDMGAFRARVTQYMAGAPQEDDMGWSDVTAIQGGATEQGYQAATAPDWARDYGRYNLKDIEDRLGRRIDALAQAEVPVTLTPDQLAQVSNSVTNQVRAGLVEMVNAATKAAVREVLGSLDNGTS